MRTLAALFVMVAVASAAADVTVTPRLAPARVVTGQPAALEVEIQGTQNATVPAIEVPDGLRLDYRGQSTQVAIVNGAMSATLTHSFLLVPDRTGTFEVGPIRVKAGGREIDAGTVRLEVVAAGAPRAGAEPAPAADLGADGLRLSVVLDKSRLYLHERTALRVRLEVADVQVTDVRYPTVSAEGFSIGKFSEPQQRQEIRAGRTVHVVEFTTDLVPLRDGGTTVGASMALAVVVRRGNPLFDQFFGMDSAFGGRKNLTLEADPVPLGVLPLPAAGQPPSFTGAVGSFSLAAAASPLEVRAGDPVTLSLTLRGTGNLVHAKAPALGGSDTLKVYPPSATAESERGAAIEKRFEQVVIPQVAGDMMLPPLAFSFFDPNSAGYRTARTAPIALRVLPAPAASAAATVPPPVLSPGGRPQALGRDLVSIKDDPGSLTPRGARRWRTRDFWLLQLVPLLVWIAVVAWDRRRQRLSGDERYARFSRAGGVARRHLGDAKAALQTGEGPRFYDALARGVHEYLAAKLDLAPGAVSGETVGERLRAGGVAPAVIEETEALLALCERVRFAPAAEADMASALARAEALVRGLERRRRLGRAVAAAALLVVGLAAVTLAAGENAKTLFFQGNALYGDERFVDAIAAYEAVRAAGVESAPLYFNLGNAYARDGDRGRALLNYERARRLAPADPDLAANMAYVRGETPDDGAPPLWVLLALPLAVRLGTDALLLLAAGAWWVLLAGLVVGRLLPALGRPMRWTVAIAALVVGLAGSAVAYRLVRIEGPAWAGIVRDVPVRFEPSETGTTHFAAPPGTVVEVLAERAAWAQVARRGDGLRGWVPLDAIERL
jgi:tetratricopeptide (TPR) repeat protein